jgi:hypothetical protein
MIGKSPRASYARLIGQSLPMTFNGWRIVGRSRSYFMGFQPLAGIFGLFPSPFAQIKRG